MNIEKKSVLASGGECVVKEADFNYLVSHWSSGVT